MGHHMKNHVVRRGKKRVKDMVIVASNNIAHTHRIHHCHTTEEQTQYAFLSYQSLGIRSNLIGVVGYKLRSPE